jgi:predicted nucleic acid-binding protein
MDRDAAVQIIEDLRESPGVTVVNLTPELFESAFELYRDHTDKQWGLVDCVSFVVMRSLGLTTALAFDQHFVQAGFVTPQV